MTQPLTRNDRLRIEEHFIKDRDAKELATLSAQHAKLRIHKEQEHQLQDAHGRPQRVDRLLKDANALLEGLRQKRWPFFHILPLIISQQEQQVRSSFLRREKTRLVPQIEERAVIWSRVFGLTTRGEFADIPISHLGPQLVLGEVLDPHDASFTLGAFEGQLTYWFALFDIPRP